MSVNKQSIKEVWQKILDTGLHTKDLQLESLLYFLQEIGYSLENEGEYGSTYHITAVDPFDSDCPTHMSFDTAVALHNGTTWKTNGNTIEARGFTFKKERFRKAFEHRILQTVYLQRVKGGIKTQKHWVRFKEAINLSSQLEGTY